MNQLLEDVYTQLNQLHLSPQKKFGQNFLIDESVRDQIVDGADLKKTDTVIEVGPGLGTLTVEIAPKIKQLIAVEFDRNMVSLLNENSKIIKFLNLKIICEDILDFNPTNYKLQTTSYILIGAIPYQITSPLIHKMISWNPRPKFAVLMIQKEVAEKVCEGSPHGSYLNTLVSAFAQTEIVRIVKPNSFYPSPKVDSAIITINFNKDCDLDPIKWSKFLHHGFKNPRKMLNKAFDSDLLSRLKISPQLRPENLTLEEWMKLYQKLD